MPAHTNPSKLSPDLLKAIHKLKPGKIFPKGIILFHQGTAATGIYLVEDGEVRVLLPTGPGQRQLLEVAGSGSMLGLSETMMGEKHRVTAIAGADATVVFVPGDEFLLFLRGRADFCMQVVALLSEDLHGVYQKFRSITAHPGRPRNRPSEEQLN